MMKSLIVFCFIFSCLTCCHSKQPSNAKIAINKNSPTDTLRLNEENEAIVIDTIYQIPHYKGDVTVYVQKHTAKKCNGTLVLLPGWNFPALDWCYKTDFCTKVKAEGYNLIMPEMKKSMYANHAFKETRFDLKHVLSRIWFKDTLVVFFQKHANVLMSDQMNGICGISSGARGAALIANDLPEIFKVAVALSGDFNPSILQSDNLMNLFYGKFATYHKRWIANDNVYSSASIFRVPIFLLHGNKDNVVSVKQSTTFYNELKRVNPKLKVKLEVDSLAAHNYDYWGKQTQKIISFINEIQQNRTNIH